MKQEQPVTQDKAFQIKDTCEHVTQGGFVCSLITHHYDIKEILWKVEQGLIPLWATLAPQLSALLKPLHHVHKTRFN